MWADSFYNRCTKCKIRHEMSIHNIDMKIISTSKFNTFNFITQY